MNKKKDKRTKQKEKGIKRRKKKQNKAKRNEKKEKEGKFWNLLGIPWYSTIPLSHDLYISS